MAANPRYVTNGGGGGSPNGGTSWADAYSVTEFITSVEGDAASEDVYYIKGNITLDSTLNTILDGTAALPITVRGVKAGTTNTPPVFNATYGSSDFPIGSDRPTVTCGANGFIFGDNWIFRDLIITGTASSTIRADLDSIIDNCSMINTSASASRIGINFATGGGQRVISTEVTVSNSSGGKGIRLTFYGKVVCCYIHDCDTGAAIGVDFIQDGCVIVGSVLDKNIVGVEIAISAIDCMVYNNTFFDCGTCIDGNAASASTIINNIFTEDAADGVGIAWDSAILNTWVNHNNWDMNTDVSNVIKGDYASEGDPGLNDPGAGDFSITSADANVYDKGLDVGDFAGATV